MERFGVAAGTVWGKCEPVGQMDRNLWPNVQSDRDQATHTGLLSKDKKVHFGGMLIVRGLEPLSTVRFLSFLRLARLTHSQIPTATSLSFLVKFNEIQNHD